MNEVVDTATTTNALEIIVAGPSDVLADFGAFLRLHVADGDASEHRIASYCSNASQFVSWCGERALFVALDNRTRGSRMSSRAIRWKVDRYLTRLGLKADGISCHSLRHSAATWARAGGAKIDALADMLGHASTDTTRIYSKIVDRMTENPARFLEAMLAV